MSRYNTVDILWTQDGDFALNPQNNDLAIASGNDLIDQQLWNAVKTTNPDWFSDAIGADMEDMLGMPNTQDTANIGISKIQGALISTGFFDPMDIYIDAQPADTNTIVFIVYINSPFSPQPLAYLISLDLGSGASIRRLT